MEKKVQSKIIKAFHDAGFYVIKLKPGPGVPAGAPDVLALKEGFWAVVECKAYPNSTFRPGQEVTLKKLGGWSWARVAHSENVKAICIEIQALA